MNRRPGLSARLKLTLSYAGFLSSPALSCWPWYGCSCCATYPTAPSSPPGSYRSPQPLRPRARLRPRRGHSTGLPARVRPPRRMDPRRPDARTTHTDHRRGTDGRERITVPPDPHGRPQDEFRELADAFDTMLEQLESHVTEQQTVRRERLPRTAHPAGDLADTPRRRPQRPHAGPGELIERLHTVNTRAIDLTEALLLLSRGDRRNFTREPVDLSLIAEEADRNAASPRRTAPDHARRHRRDDTDHRLAALLLRMVTNLVQNAIVHNLPADGTVTVHTAFAPRACCGREHGPPLAPPWYRPSPNLPRGTERVRTEHARRRPRPGHRAQHRPRPRRDPRPRPRPVPPGGLRVTLVQLPLLAERQRVDASNEAAAVRHRRDGGGHQWRRPRRRGPRGEAAPGPEVEREPDQRPSRCRPPAAAAEARRPGRRRARPACDRRSARGTDRARARSVGRRGACRTSARSRGTSRRARSSTPRTRSAGSAMREGAARGRASGGAAS